MMTGSGLAAGSGCSTLMAVTGERWAKTAVTKTVDVAAVDRTVYLWRATSMRRATLQFWCF